MKYDKLSVGKSVEVIGAWYKANIEGTLGENENMDEAFTEAKKVLDRWLPGVGEYASNHYPSSISSTPDIPIMKKTPEETRIGVFVTDIESCEDLKTLNTYRLLVVGKPELEVAFEKRKSEIVAKESKAIIDATEALCDKSKQKK